MARISLIILACLAGCGGRIARGGPSSGTDGGTVSTDSASSALPARVMLFGGATDRLPQFGYAADTWTWNEAGWNEATSAPPARIVTAMARLADRIVMFGGKDSQGHYLDDTWEWDGAWHQQTVAGPSARGQHAMVTFGNVIVLEGGYDDHGALSDTWEWDGTAWTNMNAKGPDLSNGAMTAIQDHIAALAGPPPNGTTNKTWLFDGAMWSAVTTNGPTGRTGFAMATVGTSAILFGGYGVNDLTLGLLLDDTWQLDGTTWTELPVTGPPARSAYAMTTVDDSVLLFGGLVANGIADDTWQWQGGAWTPLGGSVPSARYAFAMATGP